MSDARQATPCRVEMCGGLHMEVAGEPVVLMRVQKVGELVAFLCCHLGRTLNREEIAERLWPDADPEVGRNRLRFTLTCLRKYLEPAGVPRGSVLIAGRNHIAIGSETASSDVEDFRQALHRASIANNLEAKADALKTATQTYHGDFMSGYYADWIEEERERLSEGYANAACELAITLEELGDLSGAHESAAIAVAADPWREEAHRCLMRVHLARGETAEAIRHFASLKRNLEENLGVEPAPETRAIVAALPHGGQDGARTQGVRPKRQRLARPVDDLDTPPAIGEGKAVEKPARSGRLPDYFTKFLGRERELEDLFGLIADDSCRMITLTGLGGIGKTRLAVETGRGLSSSGTPVVYTDLLVSTDPDLILESIAAACGIRTLPGFTTMERLSAFFAGQKGILLLDNCEHLLPAVADVAQLLLIAAPTLTILATSRITLDLPGETEYAVNPLPVPTDEEPGDVIEWDSVRLFVQRARLVRPGFAVTRGNAKDLAHICRALEGIPLALELAAAWSGSLAPSQMINRLGGILDLLVSRRTEFHERHRTLRTVLDESYNVLPIEAKQLFLKLGVFRATWTPDAAEQVCGPETLRWLEHLRRCSLVSVQTTGDRTRFRMLEPVREYAWAKLNDAQQDELAKRHAEVFRDFGQKARHYLDGPDADMWLDRLAENEPNIVAAVEWCLSDQKHPEIGVGLAEALRGFWEMRGYQAKMCHWLLELLAQVPADAPYAKARALGCASYMAKLQGDYGQAYSLLNQAVSLFRAVGDDLRLGFNLCLLGQLAQHTGKAAAAIELHRESLEILQRIDHAWGIAMTQSSTGKILAYQAKYDLARPITLESLEAYRRMGDRTATATVLGIAALILYFEGNLESAKAVEQECLAIRTEINRPWGIANSLIGLGRIAFREGDAETCKDCLGEGLQIYQKIGDLWGIAFGLHWTGASGRLTGNPAAADNLREALRYRAQVGIPAEIAETLEAIALGLADTNPTAAVSLIAAATTIREKAGTPVPNVDRADLETATQELLAQLSEGRFERAYQRGGAFQTGEAVAFGLGIGS